MVEYTQDHILKQKSFKGLPIEKVIEIFLSEEPSLELAHKIVKHYSLKAIKQIKIPSDKKVEALLNLHPQQKNEQKKAAIEFFLSDEYAEQTRKKNINYLCTEGHSYFKFLDEQKRESLFEPNYTESFTHIFSTCLRYFKKWISNILSENNNTAKNIRTQLFRGEKNDKLVTELISQISLCKKLFSKNPVEFERNKESFKKLIKLATKPARFIITLLSALPKMSNDQLEELLVETCIQIAGDSTISDVDKREFFQTLGKSSKNFKSLKQHTMRYIGKILAPHVYGDRILNTHGKPDRKLFGHNRAREGYMIHHQTRSKKSSSNADNAVKFSDKEWNIVRSFIENPYLSDFYTFTADELQTVIDAKNFKTQNTVAIVNNENLYGRINKRYIRYTQPSIKQHSFSPDQGSEELKLKNVFFYLKKLKDANQLTDPSITNKKIDKLLLINIIFNNDEKLRIIRDELAINFRESINELLEDLWNEGASIIWKLLDSETQEDLINKYSGLKKLIITNQQHDLLKKSLNNPLQLNDNEVIDICNSEILFKLFEKGYRCEAKPIADLHPYFYLKTHGKNPNGSGLITILIEQGETLHAKVVYHLFPEKLNTIIENFSKEVIPKLQNLNIESIYKLAKKYLFIKNHTNSVEFVDHIVRRNKIEEIQILLKNIKEPELIRYLFKNVKDNTFLELLSNSLEHKSLWTTVLYQRLESNQCSSLLEDESVLQFIINNATSDQLIFLAFKYTNFYNKLKDKNALSKLAPKREINSKILVDENKLIEFYNSAPSDSHKSQLFEVINSSLTEMTLSQLIHIGLKIEVFQINICKQIGTLLNSIEVIAELTNYMREVNNQPLILTMILTEHKTQILNLIKENDNEEALALLLKNEAFTSWMLNNADAEFIINLAEKPASHKVLSQSGCLIKLIQKTQNKIELKQAIKNLKRIYKNQSESQIFLELQTLFLSSMNGKELIDCLSICLDDNSDLSQKIINDIYSNKDTRLHAKIWNDNGIDGLLILDTTDLNELTRFICIQYLDQWAGKEIKSFLENESFIAWVFSSSEENKIEREKILQKALEHCTYTEFERLLKNKKAKSFIVDYLLKHGNFLQALLKDRTFAELKTLMDIDGKIHSHLISHTELLNPFFNKKITAEEAKTIYEWLQTVQNDINKDEKDEIKDNNAGEIFLLFANHLFELFTNIEDKVWMKKILDTIFGNQTLVEIIADPKCDDAFIQKNVDLISQWFTNDDEIFKQFCDKPSINVLLKLIQFNQPALNLALNNAFKLQNYHLFLKFLASDQCDVNMLNKFTNIIEGMLADQNFCQSVLSITEYHSILLKLFSIPGVDQNLWESCKNTPLIALGFINHCTPNDIRSHKDIFIDLLNTKRNEEAIKTLPIEVIKKFLAAEIPELNQKIFSNISLCTTLFRSGHEFTEQEKKLISSNSRIDDAVDLMDYIMDYKIHINESSIFNLSNVLLTNPSYEIQGLMTEVLEAYRKELLTIEIKDKIKQMIDQVWAYAGWVKTINSNIDQLQKNTSGSGISPSLKVEIKNSKPKHQSSSEKELENLNNVINKAQNEVDEVIPFLKVEVDDKKNKSNNLFMRMIRQLSSPNNKIEQLIKNNIFFRNLVRNSQKTEWQIENYRVVYGYFQEHIKEYNRHNKYSLSGKLLEELILTLREAKNRFPNNLNILQMFFQTIFMKITNLCVTGNPTQFLQAYQTDLAAFNEQFYRNICQDLKSEYLQMVTQFVKTYIQDESLYYGVDYIQFTGFLNDFITKTFLKPMDITQIFICLLDNHIGYRYLSENLELHQDKILSFLKNINPNSLSSQGQSYFQSLQKQIELLYLKNTYPGIDNLSSLGVNKAAEILNDVYNNSSNFPENFAIPVEALIATHNVALIKFILKNPMRSKSWKLEDFNYLISQTKAPANKYIALYLYYYLHLNKCLNDTDQLSIKMLVRNIPLPQLEGTQTHAISQGLSAATQAKSFETEEQTSEVVHLVSPLAIPESATDIAASSLDPPPPPPGSVTEDMPPPPPPPPCPGIPLPPTAPGSISASISSAKKNAGNVMKQQEKLYETVLDKTTSTNLYQHKFGYKFAKDEPMFNLQKFDKDVKPHLNELIDRMVKAKDNGSSFKNEDEYNSFISKVKQENINIQDEDGNPREYNQTDFSYLIDTLAPKIKLYKQNLSEAHKKFFFETFKGEDDALNNVLTILESHNDGQFKLHLAPPLGTLLEKLLGNENALDEEKEYAQFINSVKPNSLPKEFSELHFKALIKTLSEVAQRKGSKKRKAGFKATSGGSSQKLLDLAAITERAKARQQNRLENGASFDDPFKRRDSQESFSTFFPQITLKKTEISQKSNDQPSNISAGESLDKPTATRRVPVPPRPKQIKIIHVLNYEGKNALLEKLGLRKPKMETHMSEELSSLLVVQQTMKENNIDDTSIGYKELIKRIKVAELKASASIDKEKTDFDQNIKPEKEMEEFLTSLIKEFRQEVDSEKFQSILSKYNELTGKNDNNETERRVLFIKAQEATDVIGWFKKKVEDYYTAEQQNKEQQTDSFLKARTETLADGFSNATNILQTPKVLTSGHSETQETFCPPLTTK